MVQILNRPPSFGEEFARSLGGGIGKGLMQSEEFAQKMALQQAKLKEDKKAEREALMSRGKESIEDMRGIVRRGKTGWNIFNYLTEEGRGDRAAMDTAALNLERLAVEMQGKGTLSKPRFEYMVKRLPSSWKSDAENIKILDEWSKILSETPGNEKKTTKSKKLTLTDDVVDELLRESGNDVKKAKKLAADRGYTW